MTNPSSAAKKPSAQEVLQRCRSGESSSPSSAAQETPQASELARELLERMRGETKRPPGRVRETARAERTEPQELLAEPEPPAPPSRLTRRIVERVRGDQRNPLTRFAEIIRDVLIDWDIMDGQDDELPPLDELPAMSPEAFVFALRHQMDETLKQVAEAINAAPTGDIIGGSEEQVCRLLAEFWAQALERGVQMRIEEAESVLPPGERPKGEWARRLRRMLVGGGDMPLH